MPVCHFLVTLHNTISRGNKVSEGLPVGCRPEKQFGRLQQHALPWTASAVTSRRGFCCTKHVRCTLQCSVVEGTPDRVEEHAELVGHFTVSGLQRLPRGVRVTLTINDSGLLEVGFAISVLEFNGICPMC